MRVVLIAERVRRFVLRFPFYRSVLILFRLLWLRTSLSLRPLLLFRIVRVHAPLPFKDASMKPDNLSFSRPTHPIRKVIIHVLFSGHNYENGFLDHLISPRFVACLRKNKLICGRNRLSKCKRSVYRLNRISLYLSYTGF